MEEYYAYKKCADCSTIMYFPLTKEEAAFGLYHIPTLIKKKCLNCKSLGFSEFSAKIPKVDADLFNLWGGSPDLHFSEQDEEIILAEEDNLNLILNAVDKRLFPKKKLEILIMALCVLLYDNIIAPEEYTSDENRLRIATANRVQPELIKRKHLIIEYGKGIVPYVKDAVFPLIGL